MAKKAGNGSLKWPNGKKVAVSVTVMFETWPDDSAPNYSVQTTHLKKGTVDHAAKAWSTYGGRVGVWRLIRTFERLGLNEIGPLHRSRGLSRIQQSTMATGNESDRRRAPTASAECLE